MMMSFFPGKTQDTTNLLSGLEHTPQTQKVTGAFKSTRVINAHSTEVLHRGELDFRIMHRFAEVSTGIKEFFGLDQASMRMSFDFGISDNLMAGIGRSTILKDIDAFVKARLLHQSTGKNPVPVSLLLAGGYIVTTQQSQAAVKPSFIDRSSYYVQLIAGKKFNSKFSLQLSPLLVHNNTILNPTDDQTIFGLGGGARYKLSNRVALMIDYHHPFGELGDAVTDPLSVGVDIETGGHVFQLHFTNATGMNEKGYLTQTTGDFFKGDIRFGFNLSRMFYLGKNKGGWN